MLTSYGFGVLDHPDLIPSIESGDCEPYQAQHPSNSAFSDVEATSYSFSSPIPNAAIPWQYNNVPSFMGPHFMPSFTLDDNSQLLQPQPTSQPMGLGMSMPPLPGYFTQQTATRNNRAYSQPPAFNNNLDWSRECSLIPESLPDSGALLPITQGDIFSTWPTPELEPTTLDEINVWLSLDASHQRSPSLMSSSGSSTAPSSHHSTPSIDSVYQLTPPTSSQEEKPRCWDHGCNGRQFSTHGNLARHVKEKSDRRPRRKCPKCGALFSRTTARNQHLAKNACQRIRRYSNGRQRPDWTTRLTESIAV